MKANVLFGVNDLKYTDVALPILKTGEVLVKVKAAGICGSDVARVFKTGTYHFPTIIGHEFSGIVYNVKDSADAHWIGKHVSVFPLKPCFKCESCKNKKYELCSNYDYLGSRCDGGFAEYVAVPIWNLLEMPDAISFEAAAMMEPASVALHALKQSNFTEGDTVAIIGPGTIGMILSKLALILGAKNVFLIGRTPEKLKFANSIGIIDTCNSTQENVENWIKEKTNNRGVDISFEGTGVSTSLHTCLNITKKSGKVVTLGNPHGDITLDKATYWKILRNQLTLIGTWNSEFNTEHSDWEQIKEYIIQGKLDLTSLITHRLNFEQLLEGLNIMKNSNIYSNKIMLLNNE